MKIRSIQPRFGRKKYWASAAVLIVLGTGVGAFYLYQSKQGSDPLNMPVDYSSPTKEQSNAGASAKEKAIERGTQNDSTAPETPEADLVTMEISYKKDSQQIVITTKLANTVSWDKCYLEVSQGSSVKSYEARTVYQPDSSFCGGFSVPTQGMSGTWEVTLIATDLSSKQYKESSSVTVN